jgi:hypothetical protein
MLISSAEKLMKIMRAYAQKGDINEMYKYYVNALGDATGQKVDNLMKQYGKNLLNLNFKR